MTANQDHDYHAGGVERTAGRSVVIQAGGESRRMGRDKALVSFLGRPMIERVLERVESLADEVVITSNDPAELAYLGLPVFPDVTERRGALNGLLTALSVATCEFVAVVACDMVFASPELLAAEFDALVAEDGDIAVPVTAHGFEPFHAVYRRETCVAAVRCAIERGETRAPSWFSDVRLVAFDRDRLDAIGLGGPVFVNANTPDDVVAAEALALHEQSHATIPLGVVDIAGAAVHSPLASADRGFLGAVRHAESA